MSYNWEGGGKRVWKVEIFIPLLLPEAKNVVKMGIHVWVH